MFCCKVGDPSSLNSENQVKQVHAFCRGRNASKSDFVNMFIKELVSILQQLLNWQAVQRICGL